MSRRALGLAVSLSAALLAPGARPGAAQGGRRNIDRLSWLAGNWRGDLGDGSVQEVWTSPDGRTIMGLHRVVGRNRTPVREFMLIEQLGDGVVMTVRRPGERTNDLDEQPQLYKLMSSTDREALFDTGGDQPRRLRYRLEGDGTLTVRADLYQDAKPRRIDFKMKKSNEP